MRKRYVVSGRVQGVGFRQFVTEKARALHLAGWVKNLPDGRVETEAEGEAIPLSEYEKILHKGPALAQVRSVDIFDPDSGSPLPFPFEVQR